jgi:hypothetical protein
VSESGDIRQPLPDSCDTVQDSGQTGRSDRIFGYLVGILAGSPAIWSGYWLDPRPSAGILDRSGRFGRITGQFGRDLAILCRIPAIFAGIRPLCRNLYVSNIKIIFILFYINIFLFFE